MRHHYETFIKNVKEINSHQKNLPAAASCCWQGSVAEWEAKLNLWVEFWPFPWKDHNYLIENEFRTSQKTFKKWLRKQNHLLKVHPSVPVVAGKVMVWGVRPTSACGLSFKHYHDGMVLGM